MALQTHKSNNLALVLSGGGARGAYEAGVIHYIRTMLPKEIGQKRVFDILCGSSVGAINTCFLAATNHNLAYQGAMAYEFWKNLKQSNIYKRGLSSLTTLMARTLTGVARNAWSRDKGSVNHALKQSTFRGLLDTAPLKPYLRDLIPWQQIPLNIKNGFLKAVTVTATNVHSGEVELFVQKAENIVYSGRYKIHDVPLESVHAIASAAIPILFPSVSIGGQHYCDGGLRLNTPMSPAIQLGADKVLVIGLHHQREKADWHNAGADNLKNTMPTLGELLGQVLKTVFVDRLDYDINQTNRLNLVIETAEHVYGADFLQKMNGALLERSIRRDIALRGLKKLDMYSIFPSQDIREIFRDCLEDAETMKEGLTTFEKWLLRVLDVDLVQGLDFLTFILFIPKYISKLLDLGFEDARHHHDKLVEFLGSA